MDSKRHRAENFTQKDKQLLLERVMEKKDIVEMKKSDNATAKAKEMAWQDIANNYNVLTSFPRTPAALKMCWENLKRKCRRVYATEMNAVKSGRKKYCSFECDPLLEKVSEILNLTSDNFNGSSFLYNNGSHSRRVSSGVKEENFGDCKGTTYEYAASNWSESGSYRSKRPSSDVLKSTEKRMSRTSPYIQTLTSETSESETQDLDETDTYDQTVSIYSPSKLNKVSDSRLEDERNIRGESSKTSPYVQRLTTETTSEGETPKEYDVVSRVNNNRNIMRWQPRRRPYQVTSLSDMLTESKVELVKLAKEHAMAEERRKNELHDLQVEETRLRIVEEKKRIALYELRAQETELKIEVLKSKLENGIYD